MATDGSACLWLKTAAGRQFSKITGVNDGADTVTVEDTFTIAAVSAVDYAIGGKRATMANADSLTLFVVTNGAKPGWVISPETDETISAPISLEARGTAAAGWITLRGNPTSGETVKITQSANDDCFDGDMRAWRVERIQTANSNGTKSAAGGFRVSAASALGQSFYRCKFGDATDKLGFGFSATVNTAVAHFVDCDFVESTTQGAGASASSMFFLGCSFRDIDGDAIGTVTGNLTIINCIFARCGNPALGAVQITDTAFVRVINCTFNANTGSGVYFSSATNVAAFICVNNQFTNNGLGAGDYGLQVASPADIADLKTVIVDHNNFFGNFAGAQINISAGANDTAVDPGYVNAAGDNFEIGQATRGAGFPDTDRAVGANQTSTNSFVDIGAAQRDETLGGVILGARRTVR